jgi:hypothetical protein
MIFDRDKCDPSCGCGNHKFGDLFHVLKNCNFNIMMQKDGDCHADGKLSPLDKGKPEGFEMIQSIPMNETQPKRERLVDQDDDHPDIQ